MIKLRVTVATGPSRSQISGPQAYRYGRHRPNLEGGAGMGKLPKLRTGTKSASTTITGLLPLAEIRQAFAWLTRHRIADDQRCCCAE